MLSHDLRGALLSAMIIWCMLILRFYAFPRWMGSEGPVPAGDLPLCGRYIPNLMGADGGQA